MIGKFNDNDKTVIAIKSKDNNLKLFRALTKKKNNVLKFMLCETIVYYHGFSMYFTYENRISLSKNSISIIPK